MCIMGFVKKVIQWEGFSKSMTSSVWIYMTLYGTQGILRCRDIFTSIVQSKSIFFVFFDISVKTFWKGLGGFCPVSLTTTQNFSKTSYRWGNTEGTFFSKSQWNYIIDISQDFVGTTRTIDTKRMTMKGPNVAIVWTLVSDDRIVPFVFRNYVHPQFNRSSYKGRWI